MSTLTRTLANVLVHPEQASLKRIAWAYGCAKKGSAKEAQLELILIDRITKAGRS